MTGLTPGRVDDRIISISGDVVNALLKETRCLENVSYEKMENVRTTLTPGGSYTAFAVAADAAWVGVDRINSISGDGGACLTQETRV